MVPAPRDPFHPAVSRWFAQSFAAATEVQRLGWDAIASGGDTLIAAPTGSGKTLAAFLLAIDQLVRIGLRGGLDDRTRVLYVSPLKALSNDVNKNLRLPLEGVAAELAAEGLAIPEIRTMVRTGDTPTSERTRMTRTPPHILVTTPESLYILLTSSGGREMLRTVEAVIVDEIHAIVESKRGSHLALSLERLDALCERSVQRIGLSATQRPIERVARFLVGARFDEPGRGCRVVDCGHHRRLDVQLELPDSPLEAVMANEVWDEVYRRLVALIEGHRTTLVFVNTRRLAERLARQLSERLGEEHVTAHHGSLSREHRLDAEQRLKAGSLRALVATSSLELGIDIGDVDLVCQIGSVRRIASFLQRVGRSGHQVGGLPKGRLFPLSRDELVECVALLVAVRHGDLDRLEIPEAPLDILAQQIVAEVAANPWAVDALYTQFCRADPYRALDRASFEAVLEMLGEGFATRRGRRAAYLHLDRVNRQINARRGARLAAITSGGAIPDNADYRVVQDPQSTFVGTVNEDFAIESMPGDIFQLGNTSWRILKIEADAVRVEDAHGEPPTLPFWFGEAPARSHELSHWVSTVRSRVAAQFDEAHPELARSLSRRLSDASVTVDAEELCDVDTSAFAAEWVERYGIAPIAAEQLVDYLVTAYVGLGAMPTDGTLVVERFFDEAGGMQLVLHSPFGSRVNRAWGLALRKSFCRHFNFELQAAATEDAIVLSLNVTHSFALDEVFRFLSSRTVRNVLTQALLDAPMFPTRWRWNANRALAVLRFRGGRRVPPRFQRMDAEDLVSVVFPDQLACLEHIVGDREIPDHPLVRQTIDDCLGEAMDCRFLEELVRRIEAGEKRLVARDLRGPSPLAQEILAARPYAFLDGAPLEERRTQAVLSRRYLDLRGASELGHLDPAAISSLRSEIWPSARDRHELHDALLVCGYLTEAEGERGERDSLEAASWRPFFDELRQERRAVVLRCRAGAPSLWVASERLFLWLRAMPTAVVLDAGRERPALDWLSTELPELAQGGNERALSADAAQVELLRGRFECLGPVTTTALAAESGLDLAAVETAVLNLESEGFVFQGRFSPGTTELEWCERRLLARIHRYTVARLREEIQPVSRADYMRFLLRWQRVAPESRGEGPAALDDVLEQLDGFEVPAVAWESAVLPTRLSNYDPSWLEHTMLSGRFVWGRLTPPADAESPKRRGGPVKHTPIALVRRSSLALFTPQGLWPPASELAISSSGRLVLEQLEGRGAQFFDELQLSTRLLPTQLEEALAELVFFGLATADSFNGLRALLVPPSKRGARPTRSSRPSTRVGMAHAGRWALFRREAPPASADDEVLQVARILLRRYGVVVRAALEREGRTLPPWRELLRCYRRLEARGEIRGGRFVDGFSGEQFALSEAVPVLRELRRQPDEALIVLSAADPLNLTGIVTPGERIPALVDNRVLYRGGVPVAARVAGEVKRLDRSLELDDVVSVLDAARVRGARGSRIPLGG